jgi:hypothetical protein
VRNCVDIATRRAGGIEVALIWNRREKTLVVFAYDAETSEEIAIPVNEEEAADVYRHPFAYAHRSSIRPRSAGLPQAAVAQRFWEIRT